MPARYPPIAPRGPNAPDSPADMPQSSDSLSQELQAAADQTARLAALEARPATFVDAHHPIRDAVTIALLKPSGELIKRYAARQRLVKEALAAPLDSDDPDERPIPLASDDGLPAILAMAETQVAMALLGDAKAFAAVADRVEGKAGLRKADLDAQTLAERERVNATINTIVRTMAEQRRMSIEDATIIDVTPRDET